MLKLLALCVWAGAGLREAYESYKAEFIREPEAVRRLRRMQQQQQEQQRNQQQQDGKDGADEAKDKLSTAVDEGNTTASRDRQTSSCGSSTEGTRHQSDSSIPLSAVKDHVSLGTPLASPRPPGTAFVHLQLLL